MGKFRALVAALIAIGLAGPVHAIPTVTDISGSLGKAENTCVSPIAIFTDQTCSYSGGEDIAVATTGVNRWMGPLDSGGFYPIGTLIDPNIEGGYGCPDIAACPAGTPPFLPFVGDGKVNLPITGSITIEDNNSPGSGADDSISGTFTIGAGERGVSTSDGKAVERWDSITHTIPSKVVDSATPNGMGGFDYVVASEGFPGLIGTAIDDYPSELGSTATGDTIPPDENVWTTLGGNPIPGMLPFTHEVVTYAPGTAGGGDVEPNIGVATTAVAVNLTCEDGDGDSSPGWTNSPPANEIRDCDPAIDPADGNPFGAGSTWALSGPEFDNLILSVRTDANNRIVSADAFYALEYLIPGLGGNPGKNDSYVGGTLTFAGNAVAVNDTETTSQDTAVDIDILTNDFQFVDNVTITLPNAGASANGGTVIINGANPGPQAGIDVTYTPPAGFTGLDTFDYTILDDVAATDTATVTVTVTGGGGGNSFPIVPAVSGISTGESEAVDIIVGTLPGVSLGNTPATITIVSGPSNGTATVFGQTITYTPTGFPPNDTFDFQVEDADGDTATGTISVAIGPPLVPTANDDTATVAQDSSVDIDVVANDIAGSGLHTIVIETLPISGTVTFAGNGDVVTYTPDPGVSGVHTFEYKLIDEDLDESAPATVTITVEKGQLSIVLPSDSSSAIGPWSLMILAVSAWLRRRRTQNISV